MFPARLKSRHAFLVSGLCLLGACGDASTETEALATEPVVEATLAGDREMTVNGLAGSYRDAGEGTPVILIVPGSGPTDQDGNSPMGVNANMYRMLADALQLDGISTLRVDKRGMYGSHAAGDGNAVTVDLYAQDYRAWTDHLRQETGSDCIYLMGHSEGGLMVSATAAQSNDGICGLILAAAPGRGLSDVLREQLRANPANAPVLDDAMTTIDALESGDRVDVSGLHPALQGLFNPVVQDFLISMFAVDPADLVRAANVPVLVVQGDRDIQVAVADAQRLADAGGQLAIIDGANHLLKPAPEDRMANLATYADPGLALSDGVVAAISDFVIDD